MLADERAQAQADLVSSLQGKTQGDMASLMARYGTQLALAGQTAPQGSPYGVPTLSFSNTPGGTAGLKV
jgi:hypothetical protein